MNEDNYHAVKTDNGWGTRREGASRIGKEFATQREAWNDTREKAKRSGGEAFLHGEDGKIRERNTYPRSRDKFPPRG
ncbi:MAG: hypothetical protein CMO55_21990 [Verrucomicrobiales bacterium]|nr:hypothetical protein [Verrucomicrobiales bacterium]